ncbi:cobalt-precorrin-6A reductase [Longispora sp. K20-0274]|uniref:cobalt-precorrin-6A reductase n=1 Tax=Longispora sp. K20-0274 TaxID=3088255 RepID=UPI00399B2826
MTARVLVLGGTGEARRLAAALVSRVHVVSSLAGRVREPLLPPGEVRVGGFGGPAGLADWLRAARIDLVVDATHPFAAVMSRSAATATAEVGIPLLALRRPGWTEGPGDAWHRVPSLPAAAEALSTRPGDRVFLTTGRKDVAAFAALPHWFLLRSVDPPEPPTPARLTVLLDRGPFTQTGELALLREHAIDVLVTKDSGGEQTVAKLGAARELGVPVIMVDRPAVGDAPTVGTVAEAVAWVESFSGGMFQG